MSIVPTHVDVPAGPHIDTQVPPHIDTTLPGRPAEGEAAEAADDGVECIHVDTSHHIDFTAVMHIDANNGESHVDLPSTPHADTTLHVDVPA